MQYYIKKSQYFANRNKFFISSAQKIESVQGIQNETFRVAVSFQMTII